MTESLEAQAAHERIARGRAARYRRFAAVCTCLAAVLALSTFFAWMNHPRAVVDPANRADDIVREIGHTWGLGTMPAGPLVLALSLAALYASLQLTRGTTRAGWTVLPIGLGVLGVGVVELIQLLLGRRNWIGRNSIGHPILMSPLANAAGAGVWIALSASVLICATSLLYLWVVYGSLRGARRTLEPARTA